MDAENKLRSHRCSETQFKVTVTWCWDAKCSFQGRSLAVPLSLFRCVPCLYNNLLLITIFVLCLFFFFVKVKMFLQNFFQLAKTGTHANHKSIKAKWEVYFSKAGKTCIFPRTASQGDLKMDSHFPDRQALSIGLQGSLISVPALHPQTATGVCFIVVSGRQLQSTKRWEFWPDSTDRATGVVPKLSALRICVLIHYSTFLQEMLVSSFIYNIIHQLCNL